MKDLIFKSETVQDTEKFADRIATLIKKNDLILLKGELGSGKTTFTRSIINSHSMPGLLISESIFFIHEFVLRKFKRFCESEFKFFNLEFTILI